MHSKVLINFYGSYKHFRHYLADHERGTCTRRGIRRRHALESRSGVPCEGFNKHWKMTTSSDRGV